MEFKTITFSLANNIYKKLQAYIERTGQKQTDVIRQAIFEFLENFFVSTLGSNWYNTTDPLSYYIKTSSIKDDQEE